MNKLSLSKPWAIVWRAVKVFFGAWAFAVAGTIVVAVASLVVVGPDATESVMRYATVVFFLLGLPVMMRWLK